MMNVFIASCMKPLPIRVIPSSSEIMPPASTHPFPFLLLSRWNQAIIIPIPSKIMTTPMIYPSVMNVSSGSTRQLTPPAISSTPKMIDKTVSIPQIPHLFLISPVPGPRPF